MFMYCDVYVIVHMCIGPTGEDGAFAVAPPPKMFWKINSSISIRFILNESAIEKIFTQLLMTDFKGNVLLIICLFSYRRTVYLPNLKYKIDEPTFWL